MLKISCFDALFLPFVWLAMAACSADQPVGRAATSRNGEVAAQVEGGRLGPIATAIETSGFDVPPFYDEVDGFVMFTPSLTVVSGASRTVTITLTFQSPSGASIQPNVAIKYTTNSESGAGRGTLRASYQLNGGEIKRTSHDFVLKPIGEEPPVVRDEPVLATTCERSTHTLKITLTLAASDSDRDAFIDLGDINVALGLGQATHRSCRDGRTITPPPIAEHGECGAGIKASCGTGLSCEERLNGVMTCVSTASPAASGGDCGGRARIRCARGTTCRYGDQQAERDYRTGICGAGEEQGKCNDDAGETCEADLVCHRFSCKQSGSDGMPCGRGLPQCRAPLTCSDPALLDGECISKPQSRCNANSDCKSGWVCGVNPRTCVPAGNNGAACRTNDDCKSQYCDRTDPANGAGACKFPPAD